MRAIIDNNLPLVLAQRLRAAQNQVTVEHVVELGLQACSDTELRRRWEQDEIIWITRDEDFWLAAPSSWAVVWISCHNPRLAFLRDVLGPTVAEHLPRLTPGMRLLVTEDWVSVM